jgi:hypothetical protein
LQRYNVTMDDLEEYIRNKPLIDHIKKLEDQLEKKEREKVDLSEKLSAERMENVRLIREWKFSLQQNEIK